MQRYQLYRTKSIGCPDYQWSISGCLNIWVKSPEIMKMLTEHKNQFYNYFYPVFADLDYFWAKINGFIREYSSNFLHFIS